jgi:hypothetical protein
MARFKDRELALILRKQGKSYSQIKAVIGVNKSTLSGWLKMYPLSKEQVGVLRGNSEIRIEKFRESMRKKREKRLSLYYQQEKERLLPLNDHELFVAGLFLYWGEGKKADRTTLGLYNTDPAVIRFGIYWLQKSLGVPVQKIRIQLHLYSDMDIEGETTFWCEALSLQPTNFTKPYIKKNLKSELDRKGFGHGTCGLIVHDTVLKERIIMALKAVGDYYTTGTILNLQLASIHQ